MAPSPSHRYDIVLALATAIVLFKVLAPEGPAASAISLALLGALLTTVIVTGGGIGLSARRHAALVVALGSAAATALTATDLIAPWPRFAISLTLLIATYPQLASGLARLLRTRGVTAPAIAGGLALYLLLGLTFSAISGLIAAVGSQPYFSQGIDGTVSDHVYFSFSTMTTVGFGDLTAGTRPGRALSVLEMLVGQIYLVTVVALLIGNLRRARRPHEEKS